MTENSIARYDYAWQTQGWSTQNPAYLGGVDTYVSPGLPSDITMVQVFGKFLEWQTGRPLDGVVRFRVEHALEHVASGSQVMPGVERMSFRHGQFSVWLPATSDSGLVPSFRYTCTLTVAGRTEEFTFALPETTDPVNILSLKSLNENSGGIEIVEGTGDGLVLGSIPDQLTVHLTTGANFYSVISRDSDWAYDATLRLVFDTGQSWDATLVGRDAVFNIDQVAADLIEGGTSVSLLRGSGTGVDQAWAVGKVVRHG